MWGVAIVLTGAIAVTSIYNLISPVSSDRWLGFWKYWLFIMFFTSIPLTFWLIWGGTRDVFRLLRRLNAEKVDATDDGYVRRPGAG
jgi:SSS family solute:Na+ symporter